MKINAALRKKLTRLLPKDYRKTIVDRLAERNISVHPNTVSNTLNGRPGSENDDVINELIALAAEEKAKQKNLHKELDKNLKQLSAA